MQQHFIPPQVRMQAPCPDPRIKSNVALPRPPLASFPPLDALPRSSVPSRSSSPEPSPDRRAFPDRFS